MVVPSSKNLLIFLICLTFSSIQSAYAGDSQILAGAVVSVKDVATITSGAQKREAKPGDSIYESDQISTSKSGAVKILLKDHSVIDLGAATVFKVDEYKHHNGTDREVGVTLTSGTFRGAVPEKLTGNGKFHLKTSTATMGVRGTEFVVDAPAPASPGAQPPATKITVLQGEVEVAHHDFGFKGSGGLVKGVANNTGSKVSVSAGQQVTAEANAPLPSKPMTLDNGALNRIATVSKVVDNTFSKAVVIEPSASTASNTGASGNPSGSGGSRSPANSSNASGMNDKAAAPAATSGSATLAEIGSAVAAPPPPPPPVDISSIGIAGTFTPVTQSHPVVTTNNTLSHVTVIISH